MALLKLTSAHIRAALRTRYMQPEWALFFEVADGTGAAQRRWADALAMNMYPSRGLAVHGFEIKVSRSDLKKELACPDKAESVAQYCDYWWLVTPYGLVEDPSTLPDTWGLLEVDEKGKVSIVLPADKTPSVPMGKPFVASLLRSAAKVDEKANSELIHKAIEKERANIDSNLKNQIARMRESQCDALDTLVKIKEATGIDLTSYKWNVDKFARVLKITESGALDSWQGIDAIETSLKGSLDLVQKMCAAFK